MWQGIHWSCDEKFRVSGNVFGTDIHDYASNSTIPTAYDVYTDVKVGDLFDSETMSWIKRRPYDLIFAMCTRGEVFRYIAANKGNLNLSSSGKIMLVSELILEGNEYQDFHLCSGDKYGYQVAVYQAG